jgi:outer membrane protein OmpA-like peptidoglycan-associated protein
MKTIVLDHERHHHGVVAEVIKNLLLILAGGAGLSIVLILVQPLSHLQYRNEPVASLPSSGQEPPGNGHTQMAAILSSAPAGESKPPGEEPPNKNPTENNTPLNPLPATTIPVNAVIAPHLGIKKAAVFHHTAEQLLEAEKTQAFIAQNERRNDSIVQRLSLVVDMHECHFDRASTEPVNDSLMALLDSSVARCTQSPAGWSSIIVLGFTDNRGNRLTNIRLGMERAEKLKAILVEKGIPANRITTASFGAALPIGNNNTESGRARNRRAEFNVLGHAANAGL